MDFENPAAWTTSFETFFAQFGAFYQRSETRESARLYMRGLLAEVKRKNSWQLAERLGLTTPHPLQRLLNEGQWDAAAVCQRLRQSVIGELGDEPGVGVIDESGVVKWGKKSAGVARQYCGRVGKVENCQVGVYLGYVAPTGAALLDRELYLPEAWCVDRARCRAAKIPDDVPFRTKPELAQTMLERAWEEGIALQWVVGDTLYGNSPGLRDAIDRQERYYVLAIGTQHHVLTSDQSPLALNTLRQHIPATAWELMCFHLGERGPIWYEWTALRVRMPNDTVGEQWLLLQRTLDTPAEYTFHLSHAPAETPLPDLAAVALARHPIEEVIEEVKSEVGLADYEVRHWHGWYRHITLVLLAHTWLKLIQHHQREKKSAPHLALPKFG